MPRVIELLADENRYVRRNALKMLIKQGSSLSDRKCLSGDSRLGRFDGRPRQPWYALNALAEIGAPALSAVKDMVSADRDRAYGLGVYANMGAFEGGERTMTSLAEDPHNALSQPGDKGFGGHWPGIREAPMR